MKTKVAKLILLCLFFAGCGTTQQAVTTKYNPSFSYSPEQRSQITEKSLTVAIIDPVFSDGKENVLVEPYKSFVNNMADDFEEVLNANGFKIKGPYKSRDEMVYGDKLNSDFAIEIEVIVETENVNFGQRSLSLGESLLYNGAYKLGGQFYQNGRIILTATDPIDGEKFWKKTVDLDRTLVTADGVLKFTGDPSKISSEMMLRDVGIYNPVAKALESYYTDAMTGLSRHVDPREMTQISKQIKAKRTRIGQ
jgi:hypothetical protein